jgi:toxin CcdB
MPQFTFHRNRNPKSKAEIPYLLDIQSDLLSELNTRVVIPLYEKKTAKVKPIARLTPEFEIEGKKLILMTPQLAGISLKDLGEPAGDLLRSRAEIVASLDLLITGF